MNRFTMGEIRPDSDEISGAFRRLAISTSAAHRLLDLAADFPHLPGARDAVRLRAVARNLADLGAELATLLAHSEGAPSAQTTEGGAA